MNKYIYNFNWLLLEKVIRIAGGLFITIWVSKYLGAHDFGVFNYALAFIAFFSWASHLGLNQIVVRELTKCPDKAEKVLGTAFFMKLIGALISVVMISVVVTFIMPGDSLVRWAVVLASSIYIFRAFDVFDFLYQSKVQSKYSTIARNVAFIVIFLLQVYFISAKLPVMYFLGATVVEACLAGFIMFFLYIKMGNDLKKWSFDRAIAIELFKYSWPLMISVFLISVHMKIDQVMIGSFLSFEDVGVYSIAVRLSESWFFIPTIIVSTMMPYFIALKERDETLYRKRLMQLFSLMFWLGLFVGLITYWIGKDVIVYLFGNEYEGAYNALLYNIWGGVFIAQGLAAGILMIAENLQNFRLYVQVMAVCANVTLNAILIPELGISGAAISTLLTQFFATWVFGLIFRDLRPVTLMMIKATMPHYMIAGSEKEMK